ncbi:MipA/OmpV family protein [Mangrovicoccus algicola]|uniref:MipA/OmpV family protein n=1 Tax=Mangrovicoccus algicola TaxID=2771008 RepID=A0A8J6Z7R4_9RHOB|nr:MipA/OmpV family protein [Mangrovicoccus algicola]MBE3639534.1 MipA/OmpV family protein [Mangrovicoccus algicola]
MRPAAALALLLLAGPAAAESPLLALPGFPDYAVLGVGSGPARIGDEDRLWAAVPAARKSFGQRYVSLEANYLSINLSRQPGFQAGPAGILRFGREEAEDENGRALDDIPISVGLGGFVAWETGGPDPRDRWRAGLGLLQDATGADGGHVADLSLRRWFPVGRYALFGIGAAASWASGNYMDTYFSTDAGGGASGYDADAGWRDARITAVFVQPVSEKWAIGAGMMYSRLLGEAADSPATLSADQIYAGLGIARSW